MDLCYNWSMSIPASHPFEWYTAYLKPGSQEIFTESWYEGIKNSKIWCAVVQSAPTKFKLIVASRFEQNAIRILTPELAESFFELGTPASTKDAFTLNALTEHVKV